MYIVIIENTSGQQRAKSFDSLVKANEEVGITLRDDPTAIVHVNVKGVLLGPIMPTQHVQDEGIAEV